MVYISGPFRRRWEQELRLPSLFLLMRNQRLRRLHPRRLVLLTLRRLRVLLKATSRRFLPIPVQQFLSLLLRATPLLVTTMKLIPTKRLLALLRQLIVLLVSNTKHIPTVVHQLTPILSAILVGPPIQSRHPTISPQLPQTARQQLTLAMVSGLKVLATTPLQLMIQLMSTYDPSAAKQNRLLTMIPSLIPILASASTLLNPEQPTSPPPTISQRLFATLQQLMVVPALGALLLLTSEQPDPAPPAEELLPITKAFYASKNTPASASKPQSNVKPLLREPTSQGLLNLGKSQTSGFQERNIADLSASVSITNRVSPQRLLVSTQQQVSNAASNIMAKPQQLLTTTRNLITSTHEQLLASAKYIPTSPQEILNLPTYLLQTVVNHPIC